ncbi:MAG: HAMP domain-containing protein, partial [Candidatus Heimdallarchaeota archaeon]|nr:HAMP domain-containing protein [Candidatus Heimdallarchaeota archaeon]
MDRDITRLTDNAKLGRELVYILSDTNHVTTSFYKNDDLLKKQSKIIISRTNSLIPASHDVQLTKILEEFEEKVHLVFEKCFAINNLHSEIESMTGEYKTYAGSIEQIIDSQMVKRTLRGEKLSDLRMLRQMIPGILVTVGNIDNTFNVLGIEYFKTSTLETDHSIFNLADDLWWRTYHIGDAEPSVRDTTRQFMEKINDFKQTILVFNMDAKDLHKSLIEMNIKKDDLLKYLEESDLLLKKESIGMKRKMTDAFLLYRNFMLIFSIALVLIIIFMAVYFIMSNIKKPMALINEGLESIGKGDLNTTIKLNRKDEWAMIETALNRMVSELKSLYDRIERSRDNLEMEVTERTRDLEITNYELEIANEASEAANQAKSMFL